MQEKIKNYVKNIKESYSAANNIMFAEPKACAGSIRSTLEMAVKLFWLKKHGKEPVWIINSKEEFNLYEALTDTRFNYYFLAGQISDMHVIRKECNDILHAGKELTLELVIDLLDRLGKCIRAIEMNVKENLISSAGTVNVNVNANIKKGRISNIVIEKRLNAGDKFFVRTNAEFLNKAFYTDYEAWMKCVWRYNSDTIVWMIPFDGKIRAGWRNKILDENTLIEEYLGRFQDMLVSHQNVVGTYRIVVQKEKGCFTILGLYEYDKEKSRPAVKRIWKKVSDFIQR